MKDKWKNESEVFYRKRGTNCDLKVALLYIIILFYPSAFVRLRNFARLLQILMTQFFHYFRKNLYSRRNEGKYRRFIWNGYDRDRDL